MEISPQLDEMIKTNLAKAPMLDARTVKHVLANSHFNIHQLMIFLLPVAAKYARTPVSNFNVGTVAQGMDDTLYLGSNMEFPGEALCFSVHGEQSAINHAWLRGETGLKAIAVNAAPCGHCRQFMNELSTTDQGFQVLLSSNADHTAEPLDKFLPNAFGPRDLNITARLMQPGDRGLVITSDDPLSQAALNAANASYAPYSGNFSGVALASNGEVFVGRYAENAAYNPSMSPLQSALASLNMSQEPQAPYNISRAVLVEAGSTISQKAATETVLRSVASGIALEYHQAT